jgi:hypothetical protein
LEVSGCCLIEVISRHLLRKTEENDENTSVRVAGGQAEIRNERYLETSLFSLCQVTKVLVYFPA